MSRKSDEAAEALAAARQEIADLRVAFAESDARHEFRREQERRDREQLLAEFRRESQAQAREFMAQQLETPPAPPVPAPPPQPRDEHTGRWVPAEPQQEQPEPVDLADMSMDQYAAMRGQLGVHDAPSAGPSRRPGYTEASNQGMFDGLPGYQDPRQVNTRVFESQIRDNRRQAPVGFQRQAPDEDEWR